MRLLGGLLLFVVGLMGHWLWSTHLTVFGLAPQLLLILTVAVAARRGPVVGQCFGFAWGLFLDVLGVHLFGAQALGLTLVGYFVGSLRRQMDVSSPPSQLMLVGLLTPSYFLFYGLAGWVFERHFFWVGWPSFVADPFYNCLVAPFGFALTKKWMD